jgi:hypothetical protein
MFWVDAVSMAIAAWITRWGCSRPADEAPSPGAPYTIPYILLI